MDSFRNCFPTFSNRSVPTRTRCAAARFPLETFIKSFVNPPNKPSNFPTVSVNDIVLSAPFLFHIQIEKLLRNKFLDCYSEHMLRVGKIFFFISNLSLFAMFTGNPAQPALLEKGLLGTKSFPLSFRVGYFDDWLYHSRCRDEFVVNGTTYSQTILKLSTYSSILTLNLKERIDVYGMVGSSRMQLDREIFTKRALSWSVGGKLILFRHHNFFIGTDVKYFETYQKPRYFVLEGLPYSVATNYRLKYQEVQGALGLAYRYGVFTPYINATYILAHIDPIPPRFYVRFPTGELSEGVDSESLIGHTNFGLSLGLTLAACKKGCLSLEWRAINQNAINVNGEIRF